MADAAKWIVACEPALPWRQGEFLQAYRANRLGAVEATLEADLLASAVRSLMEERDLWEGPPSQLLD